MERTSIVLPFYRGMMTSRLILIRPNLMRFKSHSFWDNTCWYVQADIVINGSFFGWALFIGWSDQYLGQTVQLKIQRISINLWDHLNQMNNNNVDDDDGNLLIETFYTCSVCWVHDSSWNSSMTCPRKLSNKSLVLGSMFVFILDKSHFVQPFE